MKRLSRFDDSAFRNCITATDFGIQAANYDITSDDYITEFDGELVSIYEDFFYGDLIVHFEGPEWDDFVRGYASKNPNG